MTGPAIKLSKRAKKLLELVPPDGSFIGNTKLQRKSKLGRSYWNVRGELVKAGFLIRGKGRGGSVAKIAKDADVDTKKRKLFVGREAELYDPLRQWLDEEWKKDIEPGDFFEVLITATAKKKKRSSGQWSRPDVTLVQVNRYEYIPQPVLEVTTFEVKRFSDSENLLSIYEAAAHSRWAHFSYLVVEVPNPDYELPDRFTSELERFGIGLIFMWKEKDQWHFNEQEGETDRLNPEPAELNGLLRTFFQSSKKFNEFRNAMRL